MKTIYLANDFGFSTVERQLVLPEFVKRLEAIGLEVWEPFQRNNHIIGKSEEWAYELAMKNVLDIKEADGIFAVVNGIPPDPGVMFELGAAAILEKEVFIFHDDLRDSGERSEYPINLMLAAALPRQNWAYWLLTSLDSIEKAHSSIYQWARDAGGKKDVWNASSRAFHTDIELEGGG